MKKIVLSAAAALALAATPMAGRAAAPAALATLGPLVAKAGGTAGADPAKAAEAAEKAAEKRQERIEKQWDLMIKLNKDAKGLIDLWKPDPASIKPQLENLEAAEKALGSPSARIRPRLDGTALFTQASLQPAISQLPPADKEAARPPAPSTTAAGTASSAGTRLREGAARPTVQLPTAAPKPPAARDER
jgi:hypothetical protein